MMMLINLLGLGLMALVVWWFWLYKSKSSGVPAEKGKITVLVENGVYNPAKVKIAVNTPTEMVFIRKDPSLCASTVLFNDLDISAELPQDSPQSVFLPALESGEYPFSCQMQMYRGTVIVVRSTVHP